MKLKSIWVVVQQGVYRHDLLGAFDTREAAVTRACECSLTHSPFRSSRLAYRAAPPDDGYHDYVVIRLPLNEPHVDGMETDRYNKGKRR